MKIEARSKYLDLKNNFSTRQLYAVIGYVCFLSIIAVLLFAWIRDWLISLTFLFCAVVGFFVFTGSSKKFEVTITDDSLLIDEYELRFTNIVSWALVDLGNTIEVVVRTKNYGTPYLYFYIPDDQSSLGFVRGLKNTLPYDPEMPQKDYMHMILRLLHLQ